MLAFSFIFNFNFQVAYEGNGGRVPRTLLLLKSTSGLVRKRQAFFILSMNMKPINGVLACRTPRPASTTTTAAVYVSLRHEYRHGSLFRVHRCRPSARLPPPATAETRAMSEARNSYRDMPTPAENKAGAKQPAQAPGPCFVFVSRYGWFSTPDKAIFMRRTNAAQTPPHRHTGIPALRLTSSHSITNDEHAYATALTPRPPPPPPCHLAALPRCSRRSRYKSELRLRGMSHAVVAVGFACFGMNLVGVDGDGRPLTPVYTYANTSSASAGAMKRLREALERTGRGGAGGLEEARRRTGTTTHVSYAPVQLLQWLEEEASSSSKERGLGGKRRPDTDAQQRQRQRSVKAWQTLPSLVAARWCRLPSAPVSYSEASWMGLLDLRRLEVSGVLGSRWSGSGVW